MSRIYVVMTGGTIGSQTGGEYVGLSRATGNLLTQKFLEKRQDIQFECVYPVQVLSENMQEQNLCDMISCIEGLDMNGYDGIVLTHGTDTLAFTANYFSQIFCDIQCPLVIVSSAHPLDDARANGYANFETAVDFILKEKLKGVYVAYRNDNERARVHLGGRVLDARELDGKVDSVLDEYLAEYADGEFMYNPNINVTKSDILKRQRADIAFKRGLETDILTIHAHSLMDFSLYDFERRKPKAAIVRLYHSGTICVEGERQSFLKFYEYAKAHGVHVIIAPLYSKNNVYESVTHLPKGITKVANISSQLTLIKAMLAFKSFESEKALAFIEHSNLFFEKV